jgi:peptidoglycan/xylan/chitin deacetylase (PgdA/CDA1 family)
MSMIMLIRYDTERDDPEKMEGFLEKVVKIHRREEIPATFFCRGSTLLARAGEFKCFYAEVKDDPLFDIQDHSYSHIGVGYEAGMSIDDLHADYQKSFAAHEEVFGVRPVGVSICGTGGRDGKRLSGFDVTEKSRAELDMLASLGVRMINSHLTGHDEGHDFINYSSLGHPEIMGFPSCYSDTDWLVRYNEEKHGPDGPVDYMLARVTQHAGEGRHMPIMLHDWAAWLHAPDRELTHVARFAERGRELGYELRTHLACLEDAALWR